MLALAAGEQIDFRNPSASRPWQHVLEPLNGSLLFAERLLSVKRNQETGMIRRHTPLHQLSISAPPWRQTAACTSSWKPPCITGLAPGAMAPTPTPPHGAGRLHLQIEKAHHRLGWQPRWDPATTVPSTVTWYRAVHAGTSLLACSLASLEAYRWGASDAH